MIRTVTGDVETIGGRILAHEHLQIDLSAQKGPADKVGMAEEDAVVEDLLAARVFGLAAITDLSAPLWGRDPPALRRISERSRRAGRSAPPATTGTRFRISRSTSSVEEIRDAMIAEIEAGHRRHRCSLRRHQGRHRARSRTSPPSGCSRRRLPPRERPALR